MNSKSLASYSSTGPTDDDRVKPDILAPSGAASRAYGGAFDGTSASCPFAAGMAALVASTAPDLRGEKLRAAMIKSVIPMGSSVPNNDTGYGFVTAEPPKGGTAPPAESAEGVTLPEEWGGAVPAAVLDKLRAMPSSAWKGGAKVVTGRPAYKVGDGMKFGVRVDQTSAFLLLYRSSAGAYELLLPPPGKSLVLDAGNRIALPTGGDSIPVRSNMVGQQGLILIAAPKPVDWRHWGEPNALSAVATTAFEVIP